MKRTVCFCIMALAMAAMSQVAALADDRTAHAGPDAAQKGDTRDNPKVYTPHEYWFWIITADSILTWRPFAFKWIQLKGPVSKIMTNSAGDTIIVFDAAWSGLFRAYCQVRKENAHTVQHLKPGMEAELLGYGELPRSSQIFLQGCTLVPTSRQQE